MLKYIPNPALFACLELRGGSVRGPPMVQVGPVSVLGGGSIGFRWVTSESSIRGALYALSAIWLLCPSFLME